METSLSISYRHLEAKLQGGEGQYSPNCAAPRPHGRRISQPKLS
jgi:hypothetical protein